MTKRLTTIALMLLVPASIAHGQWKEPPKTGSPTNTLPDRTTLAGQSGMGPLITAVLVEPEMNASAHRAVVKVETDGVEIVDPAKVKEPKLDEAHIRYQLDAETPVQTTLERWTFDRLASGNHRIKVSLESNDGKQMGEQQTLKIHVP